MGHRIAAVLLAIASLGAQPAKRPVEVQALVDRGRALPPEFAADVLLRLAGSALITETRWKHELLEEAFRSGAQAQLPYRQIAQGLATDSRYNLAVAHNGLEVLTLETRAVDAMLAIDAPAALVLYQQIVPPEVPQTPCTDAVTPDLASYYETAARVFERSFSPEQRRREDDLHFLKLQIARVQSPAHVVPALKMLFTVKLNAVERQESTAAFAVTLDRLSGSDRVYQVSEPLLVSSALPEWHETPLFVPALRNYIVRQLRGPRCSDSVKAGTLSASARSFNKLISLLDPGAVQFRPITAEEARPSKIEGTFPNQFPWRSARSKQVLEALQWLTHEQSGSQWNTRYLDTLKLIEGWHEDEEESAEDYLFMVSQTYSRLALLAPAGPDRNNAMGNYRTFLETHYAVTHNRNLWFALVNGMLQAARSAKDPKERQWILDELSRSANPIVALYARLAGLNL